MTDDIVTRLREAESLTRNGDMDRDDIGDLLDCCADEIERLKKSIDYLSAQIRLQMKANDKAWQSMQAEQS